MVWTERNKMKQKLDLSNLTFHHRMLSVGEAGAYCGISAKSLRRHCPVQPQKIGRRQLYDRKLLDMWLDRLSGISTADGDINESKLQKAIDERRRRMGLASKD